jgi:hypothetical protein
MEEEDPQKRVHDKGGGIRRVSLECPAEECWLLQGLMLLRF